MTKSDADTGLSQPMNPLQRVGRNSDWLANAAEPWSGALPAREVVAEAVEHLRHAAAEITARIERLPFSTWHIRLVSVIGTAHLLDAFDSLAIALVMPVLLEIWHFTPSHIGLVISIGYVGQLLGAVGLSWLAERFGRLHMLRLALGIMAVLSIATAFAGDDMTFMALRFVQGLGLGGEGPVAATLVNEMTPARFRGRATSSLQSMFAAGVMAASLAAVWLIPHFGWQSMFIVGALPALLMCVIGWVVPESPRWLAVHGRVGEASAAVDRIEAAISKNGKRALPPVGPAVPHPLRRRAHFADLFRDGYAVRTICIWTLMFCISASGNALITWLPTIYATAYHVTLANTFLLSTMLGVAALAGAVTSVLLIDRIGRRCTFMTALFGSAVPLAILGWVGAMPMIDVVWLLTVSNYLLAIGLGSVHGYATEIYPTRMRALGAGTAVAWLRIAQIVSPLLIGALVLHIGVTAVFLFLAAMGAVGGLTVAITAVETKGRKLEDISI
jgi:putative MFS transporter